MPAYRYFLPRPPALQHLRRPVLAAQAEGERQREHHAGEHDEEGLAHDVAADVDLVERDQHHEGEDRVLREPAEEVGVLQVRRCGSRRVTALPTKRAK